MVQRLVSDIFDFQEEQYRLIPFGSTAGATIPHMLLPLAEKRSAERPRQSVENLWNEQLPWWLESEDAILEAVEIEDTRFVLVRVDDTSVQPHLVVPLAGSMESPMIFVGRYFDAQVRLAEVVAQATDELRAYELHRRFRAPRLQRA